MSEKNLSQLRGALQALHLERNPQVLMGVALESVKAMCGAKRAFLMMRLGESLRIEANSGAGDDSMLRATARRAADTLQPQAASRNVCLPVLMRGSLRAVLCIENVDATPVATLDDSRIEAAQMLGDQLVVALDNLSLRTDMDSMRRALRQSERDSYHTQMAGGFAHEIRNALTSATLVLQALHGHESMDADESLEAQDDLDVSALGELLASDQMNAQQLAQARDITASLKARRASVSDAMNVVNSSLARGLRVSNQVVDFAQVGHLQPGNENVCIASVVEGVLQEYRHDLDKKQISARVNVDGSLMVPAKEAHIYAIIRNLVHNACDALGMDGVAERQISVEAILDAHGVVLEVHDSGPGIPESVRARMFEPFFSTKGGKGTGLGLGLSRRLAQAYGGNLDLQRDGGDGTTFLLRLPQMP